LNIENLWNRFALSFLYKPAEFLQSSIFNRQFSIEKGGR